jgi:hypothetical protein
MVGFQVEKFPPSTMGSKTSGTGRLMTCVSVRIAIVRSPVARQARSTWYTSLLAHHEVVAGELRFGGVEGPATEIVCGVFAPELAASWVERLPPVVRTSVGTDGSGWRSAVAFALRDDARAPTRGGASVVNRLLESLLPEGSLGRIHGRRGRTAGRARRPSDRSRPGSTPRQPREPLDRRAPGTGCAMSRSAFADRFRLLVGEAPVRYLTELRLARAARLLPEPGLQGSLRGRPECVPSGSRPFRGPQGPKARSAVGGHTGSHTARSWENRIRRGSRSCTRRTHSGTSGTGSPPA